MVTVDAGVWVAAHDTGDPQHNLCRRFIARAMQRRNMFHQPLLSVVEISAAIARKARDTALGWRAGRTLLSTPGLVLHSLDRVVTFDAARLATRLFLRGADAIYVATAVRTASVLVTTDVEVQRRAAGVVSIHTPAEWLSLNA